ncbi:glycosyltransferase family 2 protein [Flavobacterium sp. j3]|uniref:Glycosyltransferase family 2 protein n=1 Tax=Flavobacterium aureirubrum TaxID=3133147 RepID=A0ABU9NA22_9FLAO
MISILIPTYNYNTLPLVKALHEQIILENVPFEIIVNDDASPINENTKSNNKINELENCQFSRNEKNVGRAENRNILVQKASYDWILLMDCDMFPKSKNFIKLYLESIRTNKENIFYGGIIYYDKKPAADEVLRWKFGKHREEIPIFKRIKKPHHYALISNILLKKEMLTSYPFDKQLVNYGYEDIVFILNLKKHNVPIHHIENPAYHLNLEKSAVFLEKFHSSLQNLKQLLNRKIIVEEDTALTTMYGKIESMKLVKFAALIFRLCKKMWTKNLLSENPSIFIFDLYRLGYFCQINSR